MIEIEGEVTNTEKIFDSEITSLISYKTELKRL
jgi:hypothetical protein